LDKMMNTLIRRSIQDSIRSKELLLGEEYLAAMGSIAGLITKAIRKKGKVIVCGNGGSAADAQHLAAELVGRFAKERRAIPAISLTTNSSTLTAIANDYSYDVTFKRQLEAFAGPNDVVIGISTSGKAKNVIEALKYARSRNVRTVAITGKDGGPLKRFSDIALIAPSFETPRIQEIHILVIHILCALVEDSLA